MSARKIAAESLRDVRDSKGRANRHKFAKYTAGGRSFGRWWKRTTARVARHVWMRPHELEAVARKIAPVAAAARQMAAERRLESATVWASGPDLHIVRRWRAEEVAR